MSQTLQQWLDRQSEVPDGNGYDALETPEWDRSEHPLLFDTIAHYLDLREAFNRKAEHIVAMMDELDWQPV
jgi:hypothetical protein